MRTSAVVLAAVLTALLAACDPFTTVRHYAPPVEGTYHRADGTPLAGEPVGLAADGLDGTCRRPTASTVTDSAGRFRFERIERPKHATLNRPPAVVLTYAICLGVSHGLAEGFAANVGRGAEADSLVCARVALPEGDRARCFARHPRRPPPRRPGAERPA